MAYPYGQPSPYPPAYPGYPTYPAGTAYPASTSYPAAAPRAYYYIRSRMNGLVLDIQGENRSPGARVIMWNQKSGQCDNQLWYDDYSTGTIRSKMHDYCLDFNGSCMVVTPHVYGNVNQQWERTDPFICMRSQPHRVLDIANNNSSPGAHLVVWDRSGSSNQCFDCQFISQPAAPVAAPVAPPRQLFYIVSDMHGKVLDIQGGSNAPGAKVIVWPKKAGRSTNQLWYLDQQGVIRSAVHDFAMSGAHASDNIQVMPFGGGPHQQWRLVGNRIMKNERECLDISGETKKNGAQVISYGYKGSANQHWHFEYV